MNIPKGVNYADFYQQAAKKNIKIQSKYPCVNLIKRKQGLNWQATVWLEGANHSVGLFPFTEAGEEAANAAVIKAKENTKEFLNRDKKKKGRKRGQAGVRY